MKISLEIDPKILKAAKDALTPTTPRTVRIIIDWVASKVELAPSPSLTLANLPNPFETGIDKEETDMRLAFACGRLSYRKVVEQYKVSRGRIYDARKRHPDVYKRAKNHPEEGYQTIQNNRPTK